MDYGSVENERSMQNTIFIMDQNKIDFLVNFQIPSNSMNCPRMHSIYTNYIHTHSLIQSIKIVQMIQRNIKSKQKQEKVFRYYTITLSEEATAKRFGRKVQKNTRTTMTLITVNEFDQLIILKTNFIVFFVLKIFPKCIYFSSSNTNIYFTKIRRNFHI